MQLDELINKLKEYREQHGNIDVVIKIDNCTRFVSNVQFEKLSTHNRQKPKPKVVIQ